VFDRAYRSYPTHDYTHALVQCGCSSKAELLPHCLVHELPIEGQSDMVVEAA